MMVAIPDESYERPIPSDSGVQLQVQPQMPVKGGKSSAAVLGRLFEGYAPRLTEYRG